MSVEGRRPQHKCDGDSHNGSAADSDSARGSSILSSPTTPQQPSCCGFSLRGVAQLVARLVRDQEAVGSNPVTRTKNPECAGVRDFSFPVFHPPLSTCLFPAAVSGAGRMLLEQTMQQPFPRGAAVFRWQTRALWHPFPRVPFLCGAVFFRFIPLKF